MGVHRFTYSGALGSGTAFARAADGDFSSNLWELNVISIWVLQEHSFRWFVGRC